MRSDGSTPVVGAEVGILRSGAIDPNGPTTTTNASGNFELANVPTGPQTLLVKAGPFQAQLAVTVSKDQTTVVDTPAKLAQGGKVAVLEGTFDSIEEILDQLGVQYDLITADALLTFLDDAAQLAKYSTIFVNCGSPAALTNPAALQDWVKQGGGLYASDRANVVIESAFPGRILFPEGATSVEETWIGDMGDVAGATVANATLATALGKSTMDVTYDLPGWAVIGGVASGTTVDMRGTYTVNGGSEERTGPLLVHFSEGRGRVYYTTFHNRANIEEAEISADAKAILQTLVFSL